jgi:hypothetical protein
VNAFKATNDNNITQDDADRMYLSRQGVASSLATSTNFLGTLSCGGNLTLNAPTAANRQIEASFLKLRDNASISINKPIIWYPDPSLQITTNDVLGVLGAVKTIDLKSYDGSATNVSTTLTCKYGEVALGGTLKISQSTNTANNSTIAMGASNLTITNTNATGSILLNTTAGQIVPNCSILLNNASGASQRAVTASIFYLSDYTGTIANTPSLLYYNHATILSSQDVASTEYINLTSYNGSAGSNIFTTFQCGYGEYIAQGVLKIAQTTNFNNRSTLTMGATDLTITNPVSTGAIKLDTTAGTVLSCKDNETTLTGSLVVKQTATPANYSTINMAAGSLTINNQVSAGNITITTANPGSSGHVILRAGGKIQTASPIAPQVGSNPSGDLNCIGGSNYQWYATASIASTGNTVQNNISISLDAGVYNLEGTLRVTNSDNLSITFTNVGCGFFTSVGFSIDQTDPYFYSNTHVTNNNNTPIGITLSNASAFYSVQCSMVVNLTVTTVIYLNYLTGYTGGGAFHISRTFMRYTRIA